MNHRLILLRHAKSAWPLGVADRDRPLAKRGLADAPRFAAFCAVHQIAADAVVISPARRTQETWQLVAQTIGGAPRVDDRVYAASWWSLLDVVKGFPESVTTAVIVGHNPGLEDLAAQLANPASDKSAWHSLQRKFPTCAAAFLDADVQWSQWGGGCATLSTVWTPRDTTAD